MKRGITGLLLVALAAFFAATAIISGARLAREVTALPGNEDLTVALTATGASYLNPVKLTETAGADITVTDTITGITPASDYDSIAIWNVGQSTTDTTNHRQLEPDTRTVVFDRETADLVNCCDANINGNGLIRQSGIAGYAFPVATRKQSYAVFDTVLNTTEPVRYSGAATVNGVAAYVFTERVTAAKAGVSPLVPTRPEFYSLRQVFWVDPQTGLVLKMDQAEDLYVAHFAKGGAPAGVTHLFDASLRMTPASVARLVSQDASTRRRIALVADGRTGCFWLAGALAVAAGLSLVPWSALRRRWRPASRAADPPPAAGKLPAAASVAPDGQFPPGDQ
jgi:hypothetical protein